MIAVKDLIEQLEKYPPNARCYAYSGENIGIVVINPKKSLIDRELGFIPADEYSY